MKQYKEPVHIREKKMKNGGTSLYLDIYSNGIRRYEFLHLYTLPPDAPGAAAERERVYNLAIQVKARRIIEIQSQTHGVLSRLKIPLLAYAERKEEEYCRTAAQRRGKERVKPRPYLAILREYVTERETLQNISPFWARNFVDFLFSKQGLRNNTKREYIAETKWLFGEAVREKLIPSSPFADIKLPRLESCQRNYLTVEELRALTAAPFDTLIQKIRNAFLFSCLTGLRASDIVALRWEDIEETNGRMRIIFRQQKTRNMEYLDISTQAAELLAKVPRHTERVFGYHSAETVSNAMRTYAVEWIKSAGIRKHITFHCARHTFATLLLSSGVDLFTTSKLLGHTDVKTTQIYARIIDEKKRAAVDALPEIF